MYHRHDILYFHSRGIKHLSPIQPHAPDAYRSELRALAGEEIPGIVCRQERRSQTTIDVGLSYFRRVNAVPYRVRATILRAEIASVISPFGVSKLAQERGNLPKHAALCALLSQAEQCGVQLGLLGSQAMHALTGYEYVTADSDFDLLVSGAIADLRKFYAALSGICAAFDIRADAEARLPFRTAEGVRCFDVKLAELCSETQYLLGKRIDAAELLPRKTVTG